MADIKYNAVQSRSANHAWFTILISVLECQSGPVNDVKGTAWSDHTFVGIVPQLTTCISINATAGIKVSLIINQLTFNVFSKKHAHSMTDLTHE